MVATLDSMRQALHLTDGCKTSRQPRTDMSYLAIPTRTGLVYLDHTYAARKHERRRMTDSVDTRSSSVVRANSVDLCIESFGAPTDPTILLIMGAAASMDWWPDELCQLLAAESRHVVRYDHRDTGQSTSYEPGSPGYTGADLIRDVLEILDHLDVESAHLVGMSMGGGIAQHLAFQYPARISSLTLIATSPAWTEEGDPALPGMSEELEDLFADSAPEPDWSDRAEVIDYTYAGVVPFQGSVRVDEPELRNLIGRMYDRTSNMASLMTNHWILEEDHVAGSLGAITIPTLVLHGTEDPLFPYEHGEALAEAIPDARLVAMAGVGHGELPRATWPVVIPAIVDITSVKLDAGP